MAFGKNEEHIGLGLSISKQIVHHYKGDLDFISQPDLGSIFFFSMEAEEDLCNNPLPANSGLKIGLNT